jgi:hypothetical protein
LRFEPRHARSVRLARVQRNRSSILPAEIATQIRGQATQFPNFTDLTGRQ